MTTHRSITLLPAHFLTFCACVTASLSAAPARVMASENEWHIHTGGVSRHFTETDAPGREWSDSHPGIGLEYRSISDSRWNTRWTFGMMRDSRDHASGYAGAARMYDFRRRGNISTSAGVGAYGFYRSRSWEGQMEFVPALAPTLSFGLFDNQISASILAIPQVKVFGRQSTPLVYAQFSFRFQ